MKITVSMYQEEVLKTSVNQVYEVCRVDRVNNVVELKRVGRYQIYLDQKRQEEKAERASKHPFSCGIVYRDNGED